MGGMLGLEDAQKRVLALAPRLPSVAVPSEQAIGFYLASDILAQRTQPSTNLSAMDGYAIGGKHRGPWKLIGESRAGRPFADGLGAGETVRISTGAHMPEGADRVLIQENAQVDGDTITCSQDFPNANRHVRERGFDFLEGDLALRAGTRIGPAQLALAIGAGHGELQIRRAPRVAILDSGDELAADPTKCAEHQIPATNGAMIEAMLREECCDVLRLGPVADDHEAIMMAVAKAEEADILVTTGGASVGDHDLMRPALQAWGAALDFWKVAMKPGKPIMVAAKGEQVIFGLPGNPVSSFVTCFLFVLPMIRAAMGAAEPLPKRSTFIAGQSLTAIGSRREFLRAHWDGETVVPADSQDSSALAALAKSNCLIDRPAHADAIETGTPVPCLLLRNG